jgi:DNA-binding MarR family transcriptional regulator
MADRTDDFRHLEEQMYTMGKFFSEYFRRAMAPPGKGLDFSLLELKGLGAFMEPGREYTMGELSTNARLPMPHMTRVINRFEERQMIQRQRDERDRRIVKVRLTATGRKILRRFFASRMGEIENTLGKLSHDDQRELLAAFEKALTILMKIQR